MGRHRIHFSPHRQFFFFFEAAASKGFVVVVVVVVVVVHPPASIVVAVAPLRMAACVANVVLCVCVYVRINLRARLIEWSFAIIQLLTVSSE